MLRISKEKGGDFWLHIGNRAAGKRAAINLGNNHGPIVTQALKEATVCENCQNNPETKICIDCGRKRNTAA